jgi:hypothetical protein
MQYLFWAWHFSVSLIISGTMHFSSNDITSCFFMAEGYSIVYIYHISPFFYHLCDIHIDCVVSLFVNNTAITMRVQVSYCVLTYSLKYMPKSGVEGSHDCSSFSFWRNIYSDFHSAHTNLHPHKKCKKSSFPWMYTSIFFFFIIDDSHSDWGEIESVSFWLHLLYI